MKIMCDGKEYLLYATGGKARQKDSGDQDWYITWNYKLFLTAIKDGNRITQLLVAAPYFDATMDEIILAGDIDGDGALDLIINTTPHYNVFIPTLYLSHRAERGKLLKVTGKHISVGC